MITYPDVKYNSNMYTDLVQEFLIKGHELYVAAPDEKNASRLSYEGGIQVLRIKTLPLFNTSFIIKGIANLLLPFQYKREIKNYLNGIKFDLVVTPTPPITFVGIAKYFKEKDGSKIYLLLRDIFPQNAKDLELIKNRFVFKYFRRKEKELYRISDSIGCMSEKNILFVRNHNPEVNISKLHILPNWSGIPISSNKNSSEIKARYDLDNKFIAIFGGNFGVPQKIEFIIEVAEKIHEKKEIIFLLVGNGTEKKRIEQMIISKKLSNVKIIDQMPRDEYFSLLGACDVGMVNLSDRFTIPNIPSRTLSYWSLKLPVIAATDKCTDLGSIITGCNGGLWSVTGDHDLYIRNLMFFYKNPEMRKKMGENGFDYLVRELSPERACDTILEKIQ